MLNLKNTLDGYLKNVEVIGNTIQDTNNLANIRSVGDKVEGQELYKIPVVSCGKNLFDGKFTQGGLVESTGVLYPNNETLKTSGFIKCKKGQSFRLNVNGYHTHLYDINKNWIKRIGANTFTTEVDGYIRFTISVDVQNVQLEEGTVATPYEPYKEQKLEILSPVQLEKVGDVADRIICKDGVWGVEKNVEKINLTSDFLYNINRDTESTKTIQTKNKIFSKPAKDNISVQVLSNKFKSATGNEVYSLDVDYECICVNNTGTIQVKINKDRGDNPVKSFVDMCVDIYIATTQPQFIPLPHDQQIKLRTFAGQTNIAFLTEIPGQIKAQVPKSLGATVNTHTEQIADLHNSLERVKKLEETTVSTIETESNFTTVDATSNGYFEDVKLEGKTLVNKMPKIGNGSYESGDGVVPIFVSNCIPGSSHCIDVRGISRSITIVCLDGGITTEWLSYNDNKIKWRGILYTDKSIQHIQLPNECASLSFKLPKSNGFSLDNVMQTKILLLEGDHTNNPPEYFEGLMSVGQDVEEVSVGSCDFVDITEFESGGFSGEGYPVENGTRVRTSNYIPYANTKLKLYMLDSQEAEIVFYNKDKIKLSNIVWVKDGDIVAVPNNTQYVKVALRYPSNAIISPSDIKYFKISCLKDRKSLLYYNNETQMWEKPILREWDTIEKHSDGKYYYHKRSGEVVLNGSEDWILSDDTLTNTIRFIANSYLPGQAKLNAMFICNTLPFDKDWFDNDVEGYSITNPSGHMYIRINRTKLSTQDVAGFKAWLKANPTTLVYQLAQEEIYECTNIDLMTYSGETNYIINSGAISPKSLLKVHNNISNVVKILQEKVSLLENTFIAGLKSVLSGDMYSLATILYPEDFEQNDNTEQDIMVIPE